jgi:O-antigen/teichoic acid export membrane protein
LQNEFISSLVFKHPEFGFYFAILAVNIFLVGFRGIPLALFRAGNRPVAYITVNLAVSIVTLLMNIYFVAFLQKGVLGVLFGNLCGGFVGLIIFLPYIFRNIALTFDVLLVGKILSFSVPLALAALPVTIIFMADRYFIIRLAGLTDLGAYALAYKIGVILKTFVIMPFMLAWGPFVFSKESEENAKTIYSSSVKYFVIIALSFVVLISVLQIDIIKLLTKNADYYSAIKIVPFICYALFFYGLSNVFRGVGIRISGKTYYTTLIMIAGMCLNLLMNFLLIPIIGISGAAYSLLSTFIFVCTLSYIISNKLYQVNYEVEKILTFIIVSIFIIVLSQILYGVKFQYCFIVRIFLIITFYLYIYCFGLTKIERKKIQLKTIFSLKPG